jgi:quercetin dioxygenase-like cupin family protein
MRSFLCSLSAVLYLAACGSSQKPAPAPVTEEQPPVTEEQPATEAPAEKPVEEAKPVEPPPPPPVPDPLEAGPTIYKQVADGETARVFEVTFKPGDKIALHKHPDHVVYIVTGGKLKISPDQGDAQEIDLKPGSALFLPAQNHAAENVGTTEIKLVVVELKKKGAAAPEGKDPAAVGPKIYKTIFDDEHVRVFEVTFAKKAKIAMHAHPEHAAYVLEGGKLKVTGADKTAQDFDLAPGQAVIMPAAAHEAQNVGKTAIKLVVFEIKP